MAHKNYFPKKIARGIPLALILVGMGTVYLYGGFEWLNLEVLRERHVALKLWSRAHPLQSAGMFIGAYALAVAASLPGGAILSLLGGFVFPQPLSTLYVVVGATLGASAVFGAARTALGNRLRKKTGSRLNKLQRGFEKNAIHYMLFLRLAPLFPFWLVNLAPALCRVRFSVFFWTTFIGIIPGSFAFTQAGRGLSSLFERKDLSVHSILNVHVQIALIALALFAILPLVVKWRRKKRPK